MTTEADFPSAVSAITVRDILSSGAIPKVWMVFEFAARRPEKGSRETWLSRASLSGATIIAPATTSTATNKTRTRLSRENDLATQPSWSTRNFSLFIGPQCCQCVSLRQTVQSGSKVIDQDLGILEPNIKADHAYPRIVRWNKCTLWHNERLVAAP